MHRRPYSLPRTGRLRAAFTLVELLIVITIITVLAGLTLRVVVGLINQGREAGTKTTIQKIHRLLDTRLQAFQRRFGGNDTTTIVRLKNTLEWQIAGQLQVRDSNNNLQPLTNPNARIVATRKLLYIKYFPQSAWELDVALQPAAVTYRVNLVSQAGGGDIESETSAKNLSNAEVLYDTVVNGATLGDAPVGTDTFLTSEVADLDSDGFPEFIDGWGRPIRFYRWPVLLFRPDFDFNNPQNSVTDVTYAQTMMVNYPPSTALNNQLRRDPQDPLGLLSSVDQFIEGGRVIPSSNPQRRAALAGFHVPGTFHAPLIISAGTDGEFGILEPVYGPTLNPDTTRLGYLGRIDLVNADALSDNISSLNIRAGGK